MKKLTALVLALVMACAFGGAALAEGEPEVTPEPIVVKVGITVPDEETGWAAGAAYYAEKYCEENDIDYKLIPAANAAGMKAAFKQFISWGATGVVMDPQWPELEAAVQEVLNAGITVVNIGADVACEGIYKVTGDNYSMGYQTARYIVDIVGNSSVVAVLKVPSAASISDARVQGFVDYLAAVGYDTTNVFAVEMDSFSREAAIEAMEEVLEDYDWVDAVYALDDEAAMGVLEALDDAGRDEVKSIVGGGGCQEFYNMIADEDNADLGLATMLNNPMIVQNAIQVAVNVRLGVGAEGVTTVPTTLIAPQNVEDYLDPENTVY